MNKTFIIVLIVLIVAVAGAWFSYNWQQQNTSPNVYDMQGMKVEVLKQGAGEASKTGDKVTVHYTGTLESGAKFDSSLDRGEPFSFTLGQNRVIQGWELGVLGMKAGEKRRRCVYRRKFFSGRASKQRDQIGRGLQHQNKVG